MNYSSAIAAVRSSVVARNAGSMFFLQVATYLLPLLLIPYLTRVLGIEKYGVVAFGLSMVQMVCVLTDFGFNLSATYRIARERDDRRAVGRLIGAVLTCKTLILLFLCAGMLAYVLWGQSEFAWQRQFLLLMILSAIGQTYQPIWFFQGIERMAFITLFTLFSRAMFVVSVFLFVKSGRDLNLVAIANGLSNVAAAALGVFVMIRLGYRSRWPGWHEVWRTFVDSTHYFWSRAAVMIYTSGSVFFLGMASTPVQVAHYSAAEQLYRGAQALFNSVPQAMYPHMARERNFALFFRILAGVIALGIGGVAIGALVGGGVIGFLYGPGFEESHLVLLVFLVVFAISAPSIMLGYPFLGALGRADLANRSVIIAGCVQVLLLAVLYLLGWGTGLQVALSVLATEAIVLFLRVAHARRLYISLHSELRKAP
jgi:PST family polysaccharide transporter